jgi:hypothetical protein
MIREAGLQAFNNMCLCPEIYTKLRTGKMETELSLLRALRNDPNVSVQNTANAVTNNVGDLCGVVI